MMDRILKRAIDFFAATAGLLLLSPLFLIIAVAVKQDGGPVFFKQKRLGLKGKPFHIYKFRSMVVNAEKLGALVTSSTDSRITAVGKLLRKKKFDELPQLINVFLGQMSLVGPRPEVPFYVEKWDENAREGILSVKPGVTDYATLFYSDEQAILAEYDDPDLAYLEIILPHKQSMYLHYVENRRILTDLWILFATMLKLSKIKLPTMPDRFNRIAPEKHGTEMNLERFFGII